MSLMAYRCADRSLLAWGVIDRGTPHARWFVEVCLLGLNVALLGREAGR
jgi:hypothetical protein